MKLCLLLMLLASLVACSTTGVKLFIVNTVAGFEDFSIEESIPYGPLPEQQLDIYRPEVSENNKGKRPIVIFFYGGCWGGCETPKKESYIFAAEALTSLGYIVVIPDYRLFPEVLFPVIISDASLVVEWVSRELSRFGGDPKKIFLMGHSAGAHLAAMLTFDERYLSAETRLNILGFTGLAGVYDFLPFTKDYQKVLFGPPENYFDSQPVNFVDGSEPPALLLYGDQDSSVKPRNIRNLAKRILESGGMVNRKVYADIDHVGILSALSILKRNAVPMVKDISLFLREHSAQTSPL